MAEIDDAYINHLDKKEIKSKVFDDNDVFDLEPKKEKPKSRYRNGDVIIHSTWGEGVIIEIKDDILTIAFSAPYGIKKLLSTHPSLRKKDKNDYN